MDREDTRRGYAIAPNRAAVEAAMANPKRRPNRAFSILLLFVIGGLGIFFLPKLSQGSGMTKKPPIVRIIDPVYGEARVYHSTIRLLVELPTKTIENRHVELTGDLVFSYAADYDDFDAADEAIESHWDEASRLMMKMVATHTRGEHFRNKHEIFADLRTALNTAFFPNGEGLIVQLDWKKLSLH